MKFICFAILITVLSLSGCYGKSGKVYEKPADVRDDIFKGFIESYTNSLEYFDIENETVKGQLMHYFNNEEYKVIFMGDADGDEITDYLAVKEYPGIYKGITKGIFLDDKGTIKMYIDLEKGFYKPDGEEVLYFSKMGVQSGEVLCIRLLINKTDFYYQEDRMEFFKKEMKKGVAQFGVWDFQLIDHDNKLMIYHYKDNQFPGSSQYAGFSIIKSVDIETGEIDYFIYPVGNWDMYKEFASQLENYRENKKKGITIDPINFIP